MVGPPGGPPVAPPDRLPEDPRDGPPWAVTHPTQQPELEQGSAHMMANYFYFSNDAVILFKPWHTLTGLEMFGSCLLMFALTVGYEGLKILRELVLSKSCECGDMNTRRWWCNLAHILQSGLHMLQVFLGFCLMLVFMTYNGWLCMAVTGGAGVGHYLWAWRTYKTNKDGEDSHLMKNIENKDVCCP